MEENSPARYRLLIVAAALLFSTGGVAIKACSLNAWQVAGFRSAVAAAALLALVPKARRRLTLPIAITACAYAATLIAFVISNKLGTSAGAIFLQSTAPLYMLVLSPLLLRERPHGVDLAVFAAIVGGLILLLRGAVGTQSGGNIPGLLSGFAWACTLTGLRWLAKHQPDGGAESTVALGNVIAFLACLPLALPIQQAHPFDTAIVIYLGIFQVALAYVGLTASVRHVPAIETATLLLIEPVFNPLWTWLIQGENPGLSVLAGGAIVSGSAYAAAAWKSRANG